MDIGFATLWISAFLAPSFGFILGMRLFSRFDIRTFKQGSTLSVILLLWLACVINLIFYFVCGEEIFKITGEYIKTIDTSHYNPEIENHLRYLKEWIYILPYVSISGLFSFITGGIFIFLVEIRVIKTQLFHGSMYKIISGYNYPVVLCSILTKVKFNDCILMYRGMLSEISYSAGYHIESVSLDFVVKYLVKIDPQTMTVTTGADKSRVTYTDAENELLIISGTEIENILFTQEILLLEDPRSKLEVLLQDWFSVFLIIGSFCFIFLNIINIFF